MNSLKTDDFDFELDESLIAQFPLKDRSSSKLLVVNRENFDLEHKNFKNIVDYIKKDDVLVINDTKVIPARLFGARPNKEEAIEVLLLKKHEDNTWETLVKPGKKMKIGSKVEFGNGKLLGEVVGISEEGERFVKFSYDGIFEEILDELGTMPLPPYIHEKLEERDRYQTVYAKHNGSAAAPTAGLHFTDKLLKELQEKGVKIARVTLHVGLGTFRPVKEEKIEEKPYVPAVEKSKIVENTIKEIKESFLFGVPEDNDIIFDKALESNNIVEEVDEFFKANSKRYLPNFMETLELPEKTLHLTTKQFEAIEKEGAEKFVSDNRLELKKIFHKEVHEAIGKLVDKSYSEIPAFMNGQWNEEEKYIKATLREYFRQNYANDNFKGKGINFVGAVQKAFETKKAAIEKANDKVETAVQDQVRTN